jgi:nucleoside-diphosphate-sugar epimerase
VHIDDVVQAIVLAIELTLPQGQILQLVGDECPTQNEVLARMLGPRANIIRVPRAIVFMLGKTSELFFGLLRRQSPFSVYRLRAALARRTFTNERAKAILGWQPRAWSREIRDEPAMVAAIAPAPSEISSPVAAPLTAD